MRPARIALGWLLHTCSATPFIAVVAVALRPDDLAREATRIVDVSIFAAAGVTAVLVKNMAFNAAMALNAVPYATFVLAHRGTDPSTWSANETEGSVVYLSLCCLIGMASTAFWLLIRADTIWRRRAGRDIRVPPPTR